MTSRSLDRQDPLTPPVESVAAYRAALDQAGNRHYTLRSVDGAEHSLRTTTDGFDKGNTFAQGYVDLVGSWVTDVAAGRPAPTTVAGAGVQDRPTSAVPPLAWYESVWVHAGALAVLLVGFGGFGLDAAWRRLRGRAARRAPWPARVLAVSAGTTGDRARAGLLIAAGAVFVPWAVYLGLLLP
jgi:hypothetical protein